MTYGVDPSSGIDLNKPAPGVPAAPAAQPAPHAYGQPAGHPYGQPAALPYGQPADQHSGAQQPHGAPVYGQAPAAPVGDIEVRPSSDQYRGFLGKTPVAIIVIVVLLYFREGVVGMLIGLVAGLLALGGVLLYIRLARVRMDHLTVTRRGFLGSRTFQRADVGTVILAPYQATSTDPRVVLTLIALDRQGRRLLRLGSAIWRPVDLEGLAHTIGPAPVIHTEALTPKTLTQAHPGAVSALERHPFVVGGIVAVVIVALVAVVVIAAG